MLFINIILERSVTDPPSLNRGYQCTPFQMWWNYKIPSSISCWEMISVAVSLAMPLCRCITARGPDIGNSWSKSFPGEPSKILLENFDQPRHPTGYYPWWTSLSQLLLNHSWRDFHTTLKVLVRESNELWHSASMNRSVLHNRALVNVPIHTDVCTLP